MGKSKGVEIISRCLEYLNFDYEREYQFCLSRKWKFDFIANWRKSDGPYMAGRFAIECEGGEFIIGRHQRPVSYAKDIEKYNAAAILGWRVIKFTTSHFKDEKYILGVLRSMRGPEDDKILQYGKKGFQWTTT